MCGPEVMQVFDDAAPDVLIGSEGRDWLFARVNGDFADEITDLGPDELSGA